MTLIDSIRKAISEINQVTDKAPARVVIASDVWRSLTAMATIKDRNLVRRNTFAGLPFEMNHGLAPGEWFTHDRAGEVLSFNGDEKRIRMIAMAYRRSGCPHCGYRHPPDGLCV